MNYDITIIGGGQNGLICACALASLQFNVVLIEQRSLSDIPVNPDGRSFALSASSAEILQSFNLWDCLLPDLSPINEIRITDNHSPLFLHFDHKFLGDAPLGYMIQSQAMFKSIYLLAQSLPSLKILSPAAYSKVTCTSDKVNITLSNGDNIASKLLIAADGKNSPLRELFAIKSLQRDYKQSAIVCTIRHELHHEYIAQEKFFSSGPFAILPLRGGYHSSIVWTEKHTTANLLLQQNEAEFIYFLEQKFGDYLGTLQLAGQRSAYPLSYLFAKKYYSKRLALIGDSAHFIHPLAGQGLNLGIRDVAALSARLQEARELGLDYGTNLVLEQYAKMREPDNLAMLAITDSLNCLFSHDSAPINILRKLGIATVNQVPYLQKFFMRYATFHHHLK